MSKSLQDQLLSAGLVSKTQVSKANAAKRKKNRQQPKGSKPTNENSARIQQSKTEKTQRDRDLNQKQSQKKDLKAQHAQIRQLISSNLIAKDDNGFAFNFEYQGRVKTIYLSEITKNQVIKGTLAVVKMDNRYELVPVQIAKKIREKNDSLIAVLNDSPENSKIENDPYADYEIPDDLTW